jgi:uncharacterized lipoprotein YmbA
MKFKSLLSNTLLISVVAVCLSGCVGKSPPPNFYILTSLQEIQKHSQKTDPASTIAIGIGPVTLADYIDQPKIITRTGDNQLVRAEFEQWAGSFKDNVTNVLAENIGLLQATEQVHIYPWRLSLPIDYQIQLDVLRCDGVLGQEVQLVARWSVFQGRDKKLLVTNRSNIREPVGDMSYASFVAAQSKALERLSREISQALPPLN